MGNFQESIRLARDDFRRARREAAMESIVARFTGKSTELLSYDEVYQKLKVTGSADKGLRDIPIVAIVGSVGRYSDFTRSFLPRHDSDESRWAQVMAATTNPSSSGLPPIEVYQIGEVYFVRDGHHRVSIAKQLGVNTIEAFVTEVRTKVPLVSEESLDEAIVLVEYAEFLERTKLNQSRPHADLKTTVPNQYTKLESYIELLRRRTEEKEHRQLTLEEAAALWFDEWYQPLIEVIRDQGILRDFPGRTETDVYVWVAEHRAAMQEELGWRVSPEAVVKELADQKGVEVGEWRKDKLQARYTEKLFADVLVPLSGDEDSWDALEQALLIADREGSRLYGLHVVPNEVAKESAGAAAVKAKFEARCAEAGVVGQLAVEVGEIANKICERAALTDLIVVNLAHPPSAQLFARLGSGFRTLIHRSPRPIVAVPALPTQMKHALLSYSADKPKAEEALFVAVYLAEMWNTKLTVLTVGASDERLTRVRSYLEFHEVQADFVNEMGTHEEAVLKNVTALNCDVVLLGGYSAPPVVEAVLGSSLDEVLREAKVPLWLCR